MTQPYDRSPSRPFGPTSFEGPTQFGDEPKDQAAVAASEVTASAPTEARVEGEGVAMALGQSEGRSQGEGPDSKNSEQPKRARGEFADGEVFARPDAQPTYGGPPDPRPSSAVDGTPQRAALDVGQGASPFIDWGTVMRVGGVYGILYLALSTISAIAIIILGVDIINNSNTITILMIISIISFVMRPVAAALYPVIGAKKSAITTARGAIGGAVTVAAAGIVAAPFSAILGGVMAAAVLPGPQAQFALAALLPSTAINMVGEVILALIFAAPAGTIAGYVVARRQRARGEFADGEVFARPDAQPTYGGPPDPRPSSPVGVSTQGAPSPMEFRGTGNEYLGFLVIRVLLVIVTFGIYGFWFAAARRTWLMERTYVHGQALVHKGRLGDSALTTLVSMGLSLVTLGLYRPWGRVRQERYQWRNTRTADGRSCRFVGTGVEYLGVGIGAMACRIIPFGIGKGLAMHMRTRWAQQSLVIGGERVRFVGGAGELIGMQFVGGLLSALTFGFYYPWHAVKVEQWKCRSSLVAWGEDRSTQGLDPFEETLVRVARNPNTWKYGAPVVGGAVALLALLLFVVPAVRGWMSGDDADNYANNGQSPLPDDDREGGFYDNYTEIEHSPAPAGYVAPAPSVPLPPPLRALIDCLGGGSDLSRLTYTDVESVKSCLATISSRKAFQAEVVCSVQPEEVWRTEGAWDPCTLQSPSRTRGVVRLNAIFQGGQLAGVTLSSTRDQSGGCSGSVFGGYAQSASSLGVSQGGSIWRVGGWFHRFDSEVATVQGTSLVEDRYTLLRGDVYLSGALAPGYSGLSVNGVPYAQGSIPADVWSAASDLGFDMGCPTVQLVGLVGQSSAAVQQQCPNLEQSRAYMDLPGERLKPAQAGRGRRGQPKMALAAVGSPAIVTEVLIDVPDKGQRLWKSMKSSMGPSAQYDCTGHAWRQGNFLVRARPGGGRLRVAWTPINGHEAFSWIAPRAELSPSWR